jgi:class 3 adenylate cyclase/tetratricopeptide (TPR) repeat protein
MSESSAPRSRRGMPDLSKLYDSIETSTTPDPLKGLAPQPESAQSGEADGAQFAAQIHLPPELQTYLPPDLWRKLSAETPRAGIYMNAQERLQSLLYTIATYLPGDLVQEKMERPVPGLVSGRMLRGCLLFSDVSGFTALSERLATLGPQGAEHLTGFINDYFTSMIDIISWSNGTLVKFAGDATLIFFPEQENGAHVLWAARAGLRMLRAMSAFANIPTPLGALSLAMKLGLASGSFLAASIGSAKRMEYGLIGQAVSETLQAEGNASAGQIALNENAAQVLKNQFGLAPAKQAGFYLLKTEDVGDLDTFEIRPGARRARRSMGWDAEIPEIAREIEKTVSQIQALTPYLASELVDRIVTHANQRQVQSEYRPTAVLFCNFVGPEELLALWGEAGIQRVTGLLSAYFEDMNEAITQYGGIVSRIDPYARGTKLLALFGAPVAHEDDPQRAVSAAFAMNNAVQALNRRWAQKFARHLPPDYAKPLIEHRIGITLGETFAGQAGSSTRREYTVMGDDVNLAARLMSAANFGQILISERVLERIDALFVTRKLAPISVKGKKKPIPIAQVDGPREDTLLTRIAARPLIIGRRRESDLAWKVFENALQPKCGVLMLEGPAGIGKSHLADALLQRAHTEGWHVQPLQCRSYLAEEPYAAWTRLIRSLAGITPIDHALIQREKFDALTQKLALSAEHSATLASLLGLADVRAAAENTAQPAEQDLDLFNLVRNKKASRRASSLDVFEQLDGFESKASAKIPTQDRESRQRARALAALFRPFCASAALVIFFEDAQWMDAASLALLPDITEQLADQPLIFLLARRTQTDAPSLGTVIELDPFTRTETAEMVAAILTSGLADIIHEQSSGSPLFADEITRWLKNAYNIDESGVQNVLQSSDMLQKMALSRLENLPEGLREIVRLGSVIGMEFRRSEIQALLEPARDSVTLSQSLQQLVKLRYLKLLESSVDARYAFAQVIFRDIIYASLPFERRRDLHARLAQHLMSAMPNQRRKLRDKIAAFLEESTESPLENAQRLSYHFEMSEQWQSAALQLLDAAGLPSPKEPALNESIYAQAVSLLEKYPADAFPPEAATVKTRALLALGDCAAYQSELASAVTAYEQAFALPREHQTDEQRAALAIRLALTLPSQGKAARAETFLAEEAGRAPQALAWKLHAARAWLAWRTRSTDAAALWAQVIQPESISRAERPIAALLRELGQDWLGAAQMYQDAGLAVGVGLMHIRNADALCRAAEFSQAEAHYQTATEIWQTSHSNCGMALTFYRRAEMAWKDGRHEQKTLSLLQEALNELEKSPPGLQAEPRIIIQKALAGLKGSQSAEWGEWQWQPFDDLFRIQLFLPIL